MTPTHVEQQLGLIEREAAEIADLARLLNTVLRRIANNVVDVVHVAEVAPGLALLASDIDKRACAILDAADEMQPSPVLARLLRRAQASENDGPR